MNVWAAYSYAVDGTKWEHFEPFRAIAAQMVKSTTLGTILKHFGPRPPKLSKSNTVGTILDHFGPRLWGPFRSISDQGRPNGQNLQLWVAFWIFRTMGVQMVRFEYFRNHFGSFRTKAAQMIKIDHFGDQCSKLLYLSVWVACVRNYRERSQKC